METEYNYVCPDCSKECSVPESLTGQNLICPNCSHEFFATAPEPQQLPAQDFSLPDKLPFFKSSRKKILEKRMAELVADGELDKRDDGELKELAHKLQLNDADFEKIKEPKFLEEFAPLKKRIEASWQATDEDLDAIKFLEKKYDIELDMGGDINLMRSIYLLEVKQQQPQPIKVNVMLDGDESAFYSVSTTWQQMRTTKQGYSGVSVSMPSGIKGVRFRVGNYTPMLSTDLTPLSDGVLYVTSKRILFNGQMQSTTITLKKIIDCEVFQDGLKVEKQTGKPDWFSMALRDARYIYALVNALK